MRNARFDGLRGLAILMVIAQHYIANVVRGYGGAWKIAHDIANRGFSGVDLFFVLSGFLICGILLDNRLSKNLVSAFAVRRALRILPLYFVLLAAFMLVRRSVAGTPLQWTTENPIPMSRYFLFVQNFAMAHKGFGNRWLEITWSLAVEEQFYLALPLLFMLLPRRALAAFMGAIVVAAPILRSHYSFMPAFVLLQCRADCLAAGALLAMAVRQPRLLGLMVHHRPALSVASLPLGVLWFVSSASFAPLTGTCSAAFFTLLVALAAMPVPGLIGRFLGWQPLAALGRVSYGVYLIHAMVAGLVFAAAGSPLSLRTPADGVRMGTAFLLTLIVAAVSWFCFEKPLIRWSHRFSYE